MDYNNNVSQAKKPTTRKSVKILWTVFIAGFLGVVALLLCANFGLFGEMPSIKELQNQSASQASLVYADDGSIMGKYYLEDRINVKYKEISPYVIKALVATEDERFYEHSGIDSKSLLRAIFSLGGEGGGSTITMQTAKNLFTENWATRNALLRVLQKIKECIIAVKLERYFTKNEIITLYLNTVVFGDNVFGIRNASRTFFQRDPDKLSVGQAAVLVGMLKAPTAYNPRIYPERSQARRNVVLNQMVRNNFLSSSEADAIKDQPITLDYKKLNETTGIAPYFQMILAQQLKSWCRNHQKPDGTNYNIYKDGLKIYTTLNPTMQQYAEDAVNRHMNEMQGELNQQSNIRNGSVWKGHEYVLRNAMKISDRWRNLKDEGLSDEDIEKTFHEKTPMTIFSWNKEHSKDTTMTPYDSIKYMRQMLQAGFMAMDPVTGEIKAWVGGIDFKYFKYDHVNINTKRQVGSTIKPLLYSLAIEQKGYTPNTRVEDQQQDFGSLGLVPATTKSCTGNTMPMSQALALSKNCATAYIMKSLGDGSSSATMFINFLRLCGIESQIPAVPSIALGSCEISLFEMMKAYSMFAGHGFNVQPMLITRIEDRNGNVLMNNTPQRKRVISASTAYQVEEMMQLVMKNGTGRRIWSYDVNGEIAGKTGTTNDNSDAWFIGYTPQILCGAWAGCDDRFIRFESEHLGQGSSLALPIWAYFYDKASNNRKIGLSTSFKFVKPEGFNDDNTNSWINDAGDGDEDVDDNNSAPAEQSNDDELGDGLNDNDPAAVPAKENKTASAKKSSAPSKSAALAPKPKAIMPKKTTAKI